jgi:hypothetical protein
MQFRLRTVFVVFVFVWSSMGAFGLTGLAIAIYLLFLIVSLWLRRWGHAVALRCFAAITVLLALLGLMHWFAGVVYFDGVVAQMSARGLCGRRLRAITHAVLQYESVYGRFPPAYIPDENGRPAHSWRVLILPYLGQESLYGKYDFSEPWDGPHNRQLVDKMPSVFRCPASKDMSPVTNYVAITGPGTVWPGSESCSARDVRDAETVLLVEIADSDICWMEPRDLRLDEECSENRRLWRAMTSYHAVGRFLYSSPAGGYVSFANDWSCLWFMRGHPTGEEVGALLSIQGGEPVELDRLDLWRPVRIHWGHCISVLIFVASCVLLLGGVVVCNGPANLTSEK